MDSSPLSFEELKAYATSETQMRYLDAIIKANGNVSAAADNVQRSRATLRDVIKLLRGRAAKQGNAPEFDRNNPAPPGFLQEASTLRRRNPETGEMEVVLQWAKDKFDRGAMAEFMMHAAEAMASDLPKAKPIPKPKVPSRDELLNFYVITDYHLGMKADAQETRDENGNWDMHIAENLLVDWFAAAIAQAPDAHTGVFAQMGDFLHWDGLDAVTPSSGHVLDADDRFQKLVHITIRVIRRVTEMLLQKHQHVHLVMAEGNHDLASSVWLREMMSALYDEEPRVTVDLNPDPYYCVEFGQNTIFIHHGHKRKMAGIDDVFVAKFRSEYGRTTFSHAHMGHLHHERVLETNLMTVEQHQTLAAKDAYASRGGWMANRCARVLTYHREYGKVGEISISPEMLKAS